ncbi:hypothetical protein LWF15_08750 [Kineosporia rhizophila]|uniref:hypothetical protein n=1 Tax=Kineosporia TaxID=49184 RepID=UPI001E5CCC65|nr:MULTISPECIES: hypothetical protein [Kineosporia]MCE0535598.1 hypothetical protein [Kineosporia rhizophila]GLY17759.1 hypothetical protein Kisp01_47730 [Kineosporia sp. NBRC 101677]
MGAVGGLIVSERRWVKIALISALAIAVGSMMLVTSHRARTGAADLEQPGEHCTTITTQC